MKPSYLAGLIDGEGCVSIDSNNRPILTITNTYRPLMDALQKAFKGVIQTMNNSIANPHQKIGYKWRLRGKAAAELIRKCAKYLFIKKEQAFWVLQAQALRSAYKLARSKQKREALAQASAFVLEQIRWVNHRGTDRDDVSPADRILHGKGPSVNYAQAA